MTLIKHLPKISIVLMVLLSICLPSYAENPVRDIGYVANGTSQVVGGVFALPTEVLKGATQSFPFGIVTGAVKGTFKTLGGVFGGAFNIARGAAPYAKYAALA